MWHFMWQANVIASKYFIKQFQNSKYSFTYCKICNFKVEGKVSNNNQHYLLHKGSKYMVLNIPEIIVFKEVLIHVEMIVICLIEDIKWIYNVCLLPSKNNSNFNLTDLCGIYDKHIPHLYFIFQQRLFTCHQIKELLVKS